MFKYMSADVAPLFAKTLRVRFTQPSELNDPFEIRPLIDFKGTAEELRHVVNAKIADTFRDLDTALALLEKRQTINPELFSLKFSVKDLRKMIAVDPNLKQQLAAQIDLERFKVELLEEYTSESAWKAMWEHFHQTIGQLIGIFSLTEDPTHRLMWSHYASEHRGIAVEFDEGHSWFNHKKASVDDLRHLVQVSYVQNPHPRTWKQLSGTDILYTKNTDWSYEREWRIIRPLKDGLEVSPGKFCFDVPADAVRSIIFGCRTKADIEQEIRASVAENPALSHVCFKRGKLADGKIEIVDADS